MKTFKVFLFVMLLICCSAVTALATYRAIVSRSNTGWLVSPSATTNYKLRKCWGNAGRGEFWGKITTPTSHLGYFAAATGEDIKEVDFTSWDKSAPDKDNGGVDCKAQAGCYATITTHSSGAVLNCSLQ